MIKYVNSEKFRIVISVGKDLINFNPGDSLEVEAYIPQLSKYLVNEPTDEEAPLSEDPRAMTHGRVPKAKKTRGKADGSKA